MSFGLLILYWNWLMSYEAALRRNAVIPMPFGSPYKDRPKIDRKSLLTEEKKQKTG